MDSWVRYTRMGGSASGYGSGASTVDADPPLTGGRRPTSSPSRRTWAGWAYSALTLTAMLAQVEAGTREALEARWRRRRATVAPSGSSRVVEPSQSFKTPKGRIFTCMPQKRIPLIGLRRALVGEEIDGLRDECWGSEVSRSCARKKGAR